MTLTTHQPIRPCGKRWPDLDAAQHSKKYLAGGQEAWEHPACQGVHLRPAGSGAKDTGPDARTRATVLERDQFQCCACGKPVGMPGTWWSIQHRVARGQGGTNELPNLVTLCGSATSPGCHRLAEDRDREMHERGYWLRSGEDPALVPIMLASESGSGVTVWLTRDGGYSVDAPEGVLA